MLEQVKKGNEPLTPAIKEIKQKFDPERQSYAHCLGYQIINLRQKVLPAGDFLLKKHVKPKEQSNETQYFLYAVALLA